MMFKYFYFVSILILLVLKQDDCLIYMKRISTLRYQYRQSKLYDTSSEEHDMQTTWSNRQGLVLTPITTGVWAVERPFIWNGIDVGGRSVVTRLADGDLFIHSPVQWSTKLGDSLKGLGGKVAHIVAPNYEHLKYTKQWSEIYPNASMYACPGLPKKLLDISWKFELGHQPPSSLSNNGIDCVYFDCEINPFTGQPFFNEVAFYHKKSKTFMMADIFWNYPKDKFPNYCDSNGTGLQHICSKVQTSILPEGKLPLVPVPLGTKLWKFGMDKIYWPFYQWFMVGRGGERRQRYNAAVEKVLSWDIEVICPCHGDVIKGKDTCMEVLKNHFNR